MEDSVVNIIIEYPDAIDKQTRFNVTLKNGDSIETNQYSGDLTNALIHTKVDEFFNLLNILDSFGFVELDGGPFEE